MGGDDRMRNERPTPGAKSGALAIAGYRKRILGVE